MRDEQFRNRLNTVKRIIERFDEEDLDDDDADQLLEDGLDHLEQAKELLSLGNGTVFVVDEQDGEIVEDPIELDTGNDGQ